MGVMDVRLHSSVTRYKKTRKKLDLGDMILTFFTGWVVGILTAIYLFQAV